jgi:hypothetical protein
MVRRPAGTGQEDVARLVRAMAVVVLSLAYLSSVFRVFDSTFRTSGLGDWVDPYFINTLLEHWYRSLAQLTDPASPPMYFPVRNTLGYSHGLVLYAPFYVPFRALFHPFQAYSLTLMAVMATGIVCLYLLLRRYFRLTFIEALLLTAFFASSENVINGETGVWSQRASVFLIPPILLVLLVSSRMPRAKRVIAWLAGFSAALLFAQDFYTAQFALFFSVLFLVAGALIDAGRSARERIAAFWQAQQGYGQRIALVSTALAGTWAFYVWAFGGGALSIGGVRIASHDWRRPAAIALVGSIAYLALRRSSLRTSLAPIASPWLTALTLGAAMGSVVFLWIYAPAYREHPSFPDEHLVNALLPRNPAGWRSPLDFLADLDSYDTLRPHALVLVIGILVWVPWSGADRKARLYTLWLVSVSLVVLLIPLRFDGFSVWRAFFEPLPGFDVIRDPKRIISVYELAVVFAIALIVSRAPEKSVFRIGAVATLLVLLVADRHRVTFDYLRPNQAYDGWLGAPIDIDQSCSSFFIKRASAEYSSRSEHKWSLYSIDALSVSLRHSIPTLNGYSAWSPDGWALHDPEETAYVERVNQWIERHGLVGVCELDIDARTMKPYRRAR